MNNRITLLGQLVAMPESAREIASALLQEGWDSDRVLVTLTRGHVARALALYLHNTITVADLEFWANTIEGREDIGYESGYDALIEEAIFRLANPLLTQEINPVTIASLVGAMKV